MQYKHIVKAVEILTGIKWEQDEESTAGVGSLVEPWVRFFQALFSGGVNIVLEAR